MACANAAVVVAEPRLQAHLRDATARQLQRVWEHRGRNVPASKRSDLSGLFAGCAHNLGEY